MRRTRQLRMFPDVTSGDPRVAVDGMRLLAAASHDLRQPLQAIGLWIELLQERVQDADTRRVLDRVKDTARSAEQVVDGLLDIARLDLGAVSGETTDVVVDELLDHLESQFAPLALAKGLTLRVRPSSAVIRSDPALLERVLANFLSNAIRYTEHGSILLGCRRRRGRLSIQVLDTGPGIPTESLGDVFREFVQLRSTRSARPGGAGLGLSIASRIANLLGCPLDVASQPGRGSRFSIDVPLGTPLAATEPDRVPDDLDGVIRGAFVVYVEDDPAQREAMADLLENWGCHALIAESQDAALAGLEAHLRTPDLIICDYRLDGGPDGRRTLEAIRRQLGQAVSGLILSGERSDVLRASLAAGGIALLCKPVAPDVLRHRMAELLLRPILSAA